MIADKMNAQNVLLIQALLVIAVVLVMVAGIPTQFAHANGNTISYTYDDAGRLTGVEYPNGSAIDYTYDATGNLLSKDVIGGEWTPLVYDGDHSGKIEFNEMVFALMDYLASEITFNQMVEVLMVYLTG